MSREPGLCPFGIEVVGVHDLHQLLERDAGGPAERLARLRRVAPEQVHLAKGSVWRFLPINGQDVVIDAGRCSTGAMAPVGVWLLQVDREGRPELVAPSVTPLPAGASDHIALRACDQARGRELAVPQTVLDLLATNTGAVYVGD
jgi:hypothetical protein